MTERIRWTDESPDIPAAYAGSVGTLGRAMFHIWRPDAYCAEWQLTARLSGMEQKHHHGDGPDELKAEAERWLARFVSSLGAIFPEAVLELAAEWAQAVPMTPREGDRSAADTLAECAAKIRATITRTLTGQEADRA